MKRSKIKKKKAFTLVELIIVITILSILGAIAFISFQGYTKDARDGNRLTTINNIDKGLDIYKVQIGNYPEPDKFDGGVKLQTGALNIEGKKEEYSYLGIVGDGVIRNLKINKIPQDPLTGDKYVYSITKDKKNYQIASILEKPTTYNKTLVSQIYAAGGYVAKVEGNHSMDVIYNTGTGKFITIVPSLIFDPSGSNILNQTGTLFIVDKKENLPYSITTLNNNKSSEEILKELRGDGATIITEKIPDNVINGDKSVYEWISTLSNSGTIFTSLGAKSQSGGTIDTNNLEKIITGKTQDLSCEILGKFLNNGESITMYSEESIVWNSGYDCSNRSQIRTCNNGQVSGGEEYKYFSCIKGVADNCSGNGNYIINGHYYSIPGLIHGTSTGGILSANVTENNGVFKYELSNISCNDGDFINSTENITPIPQSCDNGYSIVGNSCVPNNCSSSVQTVNGHNYNVPAFNHGTTTTQTSGVAITNGTRTYSQTFSCTAGVVNLSGTESNTSNTCTSGFSWDIPTSSCKQGDWAAFKAKRCNPATWPQYIYGYCGNGLVNTIGTDPLLPPEYRSYRWYNLTGYGDHYYSPNTKDGGYVASGMGSNDGRTGNWGCSAGYYQCAYGISYSSSGGGNMSGVVVCIPNGY